MLRTSKYKHSDLHGRYAVSIGKYLTDASEECSTLILRMKESKKIFWAASYNMKIRNSTENCAAVCLLS